MMVGTSWTYSASGKARSQGYSPQDHWRSQFFWQQLSLLNLRLPTFQNESATVEKESATGRKGVAIGV
jgi:hypothetical protein